MPFAENGVIGNVNLELADNPTFGESRTVDKPDNSSET
jgi:hypothetical protein